MSQIVYSDWPLLPIGLSYRNSKCSYLDSQVRHKFPSTVHNLKNSLHLFLASSESQTNSFSWTNISQHLCVNSSPRCVIPIIWTCTLLNFLLADPTLFRTAKSTEPHFTSIFPLIQMPFTQTESSLSNAFTCPVQSPWCHAQLNHKSGEAISHQTAEVHVETECFSNSIP